MNENKPKKPERKLNCVKCNRDIRYYRHVYPYGIPQGPYCIDCAIKEGWHRKQ